jgi:phosphopantothenate---cysteine ligase (CTP)
MKVVVTTGPSYEAIDEVRRLTNFSTGELGVMLAQELVQAGFEVICLRGVHATHPITPVGVDTRAFTTNDDLHEQLETLARTESVGALFQVAALCDYKVARVEDAAGSLCSEAKIDSRAGRLTIVLEPALKVLAGLRPLFPEATIVGWKYELTGGRDDALAKAWRQLRDAHTDACVLNGAAWGSGFAFCTSPASILELADKRAVAKFLPRWLIARIPVAVS